VGALIFILIFFLLVFYGIPIAFSFGIGALVFLVIEMPGNLSVLVSQSFDAIDSFALLAIPLFIYAGDIMREGGLSTRIVEFAYIFVRKIKGGLAHVTVLASAFFGAISGSAAATVGAIGGIVIPEMEKRGYSKRYAATVSAAAGILGILIPPSIPMIIYAMTASVSVARLFLAGIIPGILMTVSFMIVNLFMENKHRKEVKHVSQSMNLKQMSNVSLGAIPALIMPIIILGGIYSGLFTPTESGGVAVAYGILIGFLIYKELTVGKLFKIGKESAYTSALIMLIISIAGVFGWIITTQQIPELISDFITGISENKILILIMLNIFYLLLGSFLETNTAIVITTPIFIPLMSFLGIDLVHFGVIQSVNLAIGLLTPPMALNLLIASRITGIPMTKTFVPILPYLLAAIIVLMLVTFIPEISLFLPNLLLDS
jgi:C4-dicarboxylate transporter DctM subunit